MMFLCVCVFFFCVFFCCFFFFFSFLFFFFFGFIAVRYCYIEDELEDGFTIIIITQSNIVLMLSALVRNS